MRYVLSYYQLENGKWQYHADIVEANSPQEVKLPNATLYYVQLEEYKNIPVDNPVNKVFISSSDRPVVKP